MDELTENVIYIIAIMVYSKNVINPHKRTRFFSVQVNCVHSYREFLQNQPGDVLKVFLKFFWKLYTA